MLLISQSAYGRMEILNALSPMWWRERVQRASWSGLVESSDVGAKKEGNLFF